MFNATLNNISIISWRSFVLMWETGVPEGTHIPPASHWQTLSHYVESSTPRNDRDTPQWAGFELKT
jgi:hypothetical protein